MPNDPNSDSAYVANTPNPDEIRPEDRRIEQSKVIAKWFIGISLVAMSIFVAATQSDSADTSSWVPAGFTVWSSDSNIAWKWADENNCTDHGCISADFISRDGCPNGLHVAVNFLNDSEAVVSSDTAKIASLLPLRKAKLRFDDVQDLSKSVQMTELECR